MADWPAVPTWRDAELDPDRIGDVASGTVTLVDRLSPGTRPSRVKQVRCPDRWALDVPELHCKLLAEAGLDPGCLVVILVIRAAGSSMCGVPLEDGMILTIPAGTTISVGVRPGLVYGGAVMSEDVWRAAQDVTTGMVAPLVPDRPIVLRLDHPRARKLSALLGQAADVLTAGPDGGPDWSLRPGVYFEYVDALANANAVAEDRYEAIDRGARNCARLAFAAQDYIRAHLDGAIDIRALCREMRVSRRQLEYAFRATFDAAPREFVTLLRLNAARRDLLRGASASVTSAALDHGMHHLGRFSASYRALFGELPSDTLRDPGDAAGRREARGDHPLPPRSQAAQGVLMENRLPSG